MNVRKVIMSDNVMSFYGEDIPHRKVAEDLNIVFFWYANDDIYSVVKEGDVCFLEKIAEDDDELLIMSVDEFLFPDAIDEDDSKLYIVSNTSSFLGSATFLRPDCMDKIKSVFGERFMIIPSSIHEILVAKEPCIKEIMDGSIIRDVNATLLYPNEVSAEHAYLYDNGSIKPLCA